MRVVDILFNPAIFGTLALFFAALWMLKNPNDKTRPLLVFALVLNPVSYTHLDVYKRQVQP